MAAQQRVRERTGVAAGVRGETPGAAMRETGQTCSPRQRSEIVNHFFLQKDHKCSPSSQRIARESKEMV